MKRENRAVCFECSKCLAAGFLLLVCASGAFGQGIVSFYNSSTTLITLPGSVFPPAGSYYLGLFIAPFGTTNPAAFEFTGCYATNQASAGRFSGGTVVVPNWPAGQARAYLVRGWSADLGHDWNPLWGYGVFPFSTPDSAYGESSIAIASAGGFDGVQDLPSLQLFSGISGFALHTGISGAPVIIQQPESQVVRAGSTATFQVAVAGAPPVTYQWYCLGIPMDQETNSVLNVYNVQSWQNGLSYSARVSAWGGALTSYVAHLTVLTLPPLSIAALPASQTAEVGSTLRLTSVAQGIPPLTYQWQFNRGPILSATSRVLELTNLQIDSAGSYTVVLRDLYGSITSAPALLGVVPALLSQPAPALQFGAAGGAVVSVERTAALEPGATSWEPLTNVLLTNAGQWFIDESGLREQAFYRVRQTNPAASSLSFALVPAAYLSGAMGNSVRLDYINRVGPTNAWTALRVFQQDIPGKFYDLSAIGQAPRLYRLVTLP